MKHKKINGQLFGDMVRGGAAFLRRNAGTVNDMNVFPIPDGDTGDNMAMTVESGLIALLPPENAAPDTRKNALAPAIGEAAETLARGMLLGARGNSGVILSQLFAGMAEGLADKKEADVKTFAEALTAGVKKSYSAVAEPVEGTILTVAREAAEAGLRAAENVGTFEEWFPLYLTEAQNSLERTPDLLPVLKEAGVADSGGAGFVYLMNGMSSTLSGDLAGATFSPMQLPANAPDIDSFGEDSVMKFGYCTEFLLRLQSSKVDLATFDADEIIRAHLEEIGESVVCFRTGSIVKVHVHTMHPGEILNFAQQFGEFLTLKIENMMIQHNESVFGKNPKKKTKPKKHLPLAVVAVANGSGLCDTFLALGANEIVEGGQTMNPSASDFLRAFDNVNADEIIVLPNNGNVILTAQQAASLYDKSMVCVLESKSLGEGYAALSLYSPDGTADQVAQVMRDAMEGCVTAAVCPAVRDSHLDGVEVCEGEYLGIWDKQILCAGQDAPAAAESLLAALPTQDKAVLVMICGKDSTAEEAGRISAIIEKMYPSLEVYRIDGGQEVYRYLFILQ